MPEDDRRRRAVARANLEPVVFFPGETGSVAGSISTTVNSGVVFQRSNDISHSGAITGAGTVTLTAAATLCRPSITGAATVEMADSKPPSLMP